ncbi:MAG: hypothetical protein ACI9VN_002877, partial [Patescibacteria group bacterium]
NTFFFMTSSLTYLSHIDMNHIDMNDFGFG